jgi:hypothetical protein
VNVNLVSISPNGTTKNWLGLNNVQDTNSTTQSIVFKIGPGNYTMILTMIDVPNNGYRINATQTSVIQVLPVYALSVNTSNGLTDYLVGANITLNLTAVTSNQAVAITVSFGDNTTFNCTLMDRSQAIFKAFNSPGLYLVNATATGSYGNQTTPSSIVLNVTGKNAYK